MNNFTNLYGKLAVWLLSWCLIITGGADIALCFSDAHAGDLAVHQSIHQARPLISNDFSQFCDANHFNSENCCIDVSLATINKSIRLPLSFHHPVMFSTGSLLNTDEMAWLYNQRPDPEATFPVPSPPLFIMDQAFLN